MNPAPRLTDRIPAYLLAGGQSRRFGRDKARATVEGVPLLRRLVDALSPVATRVTVIADAADRYADLGFRTIADRVPGHGPLAGLHAALHDAADADEPWVLLASCDLLEIRPEWVRAMLAERRPDRQIIAFRGERWEPMLALYAVTLLPEVTDRLQRGERAMHRLLDAVDAYPLPLPAGGIPQANTPEELEAWRKNRPQPPMP